MALLVCVGHIGLNTATERYGIHIRFPLAVDLFFSISGFVLARAYYFSDRSFSELLIGRIARLYPLHFLTLAWTIALELFRGQGIPVGLLLQNVLLIHNIGLPPNRWILNIPSWSISVEMVVSLIFFNVSSLRVQAVIGIFLLVALALCFVTPLGMGDAYRNEAIYFNTGIIRGFIGFSIGVASFKISISMPSFVRICRLLSAPALVSLFYMMTVSSWETLQSVFFCGLTLITLVGLSTGTLDRYLATIPLVWLGKVSYSIYLIHIPILYTAQATLPPELYSGWHKIYLLTFILIISEYTYRWIEMPCQRYLLRQLAIAAPIAGLRSHR